jgi:hypothetical protein
MMSNLNLEVLVGRAVISKQFKAGLLNGHRAELIQEYNLEPEEIAVLMAIRADTVKEFAIAVEQFMANRQAAGSRHRAIWGQIGLPVTASYHS